MGLSNIIENLYSGNFKRLLVLPILLFIVMLFVVFVSPGIQPGIDLQGGTALILQTDKSISATELTTFLSDEFGLDQVAVTTTGSGVTVQFASVVSEESDFSTQVQQKLIERFSLPEDTAFQIREIPPSVGKIFLDTSITVIIVAVIFLLLIIFLLFRDFVPAFVIIASGVFDVMAGLAAMPFFGISLSLPTVSALLMLMGYSIDTDILLTSRIMKGVGKSPKQQAVSSFKTGMLMTLTAIAAVVVMAVFSYFNQMIPIYEIAIVLLFGLIGDIVVTWAMNAPVILWHAERKAKAREGR